MSELRPVTSAKKESSARVEIGGEHAVAMYTSDCVLALGCLAMSYPVMPLWFALMRLVGYKCHAPACLLCLVVTTILKRALPKPRPPQVARRIDLSMEVCHPNHSFPSGDVAQAAVVAQTVCHPCMVLLVVLAAAGRYHYRRHDLTDIVFGALVGLLCVRLAQVCAC